MAFDITQDFIATFRPSSTSATAGTIPFIDGILATLGLSGILDVVVSTTAPATDQPKTIWLEPLVNSWAGNGSVFLWDKSVPAWAPATPTLFAEYINAYLGAAIILSGAGAPSGALGYDGYWFIRTDQPGGIYHKVAGAWVLMPGTGQFAASTPNGVAGGTAPTFTLTHVVPWTALSDGMLIPFTFPMATAGGDTLNIDNLGAVALLGPGGGLLAASEYAAGTTVLIELDAGATSSSLRILAPGAASAARRGVVKIGSGLTVDADGNVTASFTSVTASAPLTGAGTGASPLTVRDASQAVNGAVRYGTQAEINAATDAALAVSPATLASVGGAVAAALRTALNGNGAGWLHNDGGGNYAWSTPPGGTVLPANAAGVLTNDGAGNLSWQSGAANLPAANAIGAYHRGEGALDGSSGEFVVGQDYASSSVTGFPPYPGTWRCMGGDGIAAPFGWLWMRVA